MQRRIAAIVTKILKVSEFVDGNDKRQGNTRNTRLLQRVIDMYNRQMLMIKIRTSPYPYFIPRLSGPSRPGPILLGGTSSTVDLPVSVLDSVPRLRTSLPRPFCRGSGREENRTLRKVTIRVGLRSTDPSHPLLDVVTQGLRVPARVPPPPA